MSNPLDRLTLDELRSRTSEKWRRYPPDVLPVFVAEMDADLARPVTAALRQAIERGDTGYAFGTDYAEALAGFAAERWGWRFDIAQARPVADVITGVVEAVRLISDVGAGVVVNPPVYHPFFPTIEHMERRVVEAPLGPDGRIDFATLEAAFQEPGNGAYLLCNPQNPTGAVHTRDELTRVAELAHAYRVRVVADEIHAPLVLAGAAFTPYLDVDPAGLSIMSASKAWNLAGMKAAILVAGTEALGDLARLPEIASEATSHFGVVSHVAALRHGGPWLDEVLAAIDGNRRLLGELLGRELPQIGYRQPEGTYLAWLDCRGLGIDGDPAAFFLQRGRVALVAGELFGTGGAGHVRLNIGTSPAVIREAVRRMATALSG
ncbi:cystathionine beta-lyase [Allocatelliglobosispora scoriae]|uniref:cysteine-S-conjugate beta-lyase n=1 Tax=Allocatelliglobosispora scoriae TaxID=643052 RepID=A0A841BL07_9ACTN|nr:aminotransferase class I/II-fold pyridoxal phosphate-dependent enzyme [Allocatelliglobosispora scoriae]MBB5867673.1 cystathionine beta-lyase [Allocatelliglobosispora scoriae]